jgi:hypothetical protein
MTEHRFLPALLIWFVLAMAGLFSIYLLRPPQASSAHAGKEAFSAALAFRHVKRIAARPHAMGTAAHRAVRTYLRQELGKLMEVEVQETVVASQALRRQALGYVYNIIGELKGKGQGKAVLVMAHYDSQPNTRGAGDDGAGIAALLEVARALQSGPRLQNDVIFLMTDGEEYGLFGAEAFLRYPLAKKVGVVINLEGRGNSGPSMTFEISPENGWVVAQFAEAAPFPFASSLMYEVYRHLPNDTDFSVFRKAGFTGVNSAFIDGYVHYHKLTDSPENLNQNSLQHHGSNTLALVRHFGNISLADTKAPDKVFFNLAGSWLVQYPMGLNIVWPILTCILLGIFLISGARKKIMTGWQVIKGFWLFLMIVAWIAGFLFLLNLSVLYFMPFHHHLNGVYGSGKFFLAYLSLALGLFLLMIKIALRWVPAWGMAAGIYLWVFALALALYFPVPSSVYILLFPLLFCLLSGVGVFLLNQHQKTGLLYAALLLAGILPAVFLLMPLVKMLFVAFALQLPVAAILVFLIAAGLAMPLLAIMDHSFSWRHMPLFSLLLILIGCLQTVYAVAVEKPDSTQPLHSEVGYYLDWDRKKAFWASTFTTPDAWNKQFFPSPAIGPFSEIFPGPTRVFLKNTAPPIPAAAPAAEIVSDTVYQGKRKLVLRLTSPRQAAHLQLDLLARSKDALLEARINGEEIPNELLSIQTGCLLSTRLFGLPDTKQVELLLLLRQTEGIRLMLYDFSIGLPGQLVKTKRPGYVIPEQGLYSNITVVKKTYVF